MTSMVGTILARCYLKVGTTGTTGILGPLALESSIAEASVYTVATLGTGTIAL